MTPLPHVIRGEEELDELMTRPSAELVAVVPRLASPLLVLGAGGKMGPSLCVRARRAAEAAGHELEVVAVSRFSDPSARQWLEDRGVRTLSRDLMERADVAGLPDTPNVAYLVGLKFGTQQNPARTWAVNTLIPAHVAERYPGSRIVALSTGNVYPFVPVESGGSTESDPLTPPGEYANAAVARERIFEFFAERQGTVITSIRLNYAVDLRYGVLMDIATRVRAGEPVDVTMGYLNCIWQGDANDMILRTFLLETPPRALNLTGPERLSVRELAERLGALINRPARVTGREAPTALLSDTSRMRELLGAPETPVDRMLEWTASWVSEGGVTWGKPSHFEVRDGTY
jgi:nucleoside-diphosphate-sugar epimerase